MQTYAIWRSRPVFVTSTFRDMQAERDWLRDHVFPVLEERLRARFHHLEPIDLRWGVDTAKVTDEQQRELLVLKVCLAEIQRSRPFLIGLIGDRYGWVPPEARMKAAAQEAGHQGELAGKSVTALEIEYGVLDSADQRKRSRFYLREPLPYAKMDAATAAEYSDEHASEPEAEEKWARLQALKARIEQSMPEERRRPYRGDGTERRSPAWRHGAGRCWTTSGRTCRRRFRRPRGESSPGKTRSAMPSSSSWRLSAATSSGGKRHSQS